MSFLLFLLLIILFMVVVLPLTVIHRIYRAFTGRRNGADAFAGMGYRGGKRQREEEPQPKVKKKVFSRNEGEYVDFEEISVEVSGETRDSAGNTVRYEIEEQISDAEWVEIK